VKLLFDESLSPRLVLLLRDLFPESESALRNGLARAGDRRILDYAAEVLRRNAIRIAELPSSQDRMIILDQ